MTVLEPVSRFDLKNRPFVFIRFPLPLSLPDDRTPFCPVGNHVGSEHVSFNGLRCHERSPHVFGGRTNADGCLGDQILLHNRGSFWHGCCSSYNHPPRFYCRCSQVVVPSHSLAHAPW